MKTNSKISPRFLPVITQLKKTVLLVTVLFSIDVNAQDKITLRDGSEINAKVLEVNEAEVKYKQADNLQGPIRVLSATDIFMIKYENGAKEVFKNGSDANPERNLAIPVRNVRQKATNADTGEFVPPRNPKFGGPRFGLTCITPGILTSRLENEGKNPLITQFGWQFEKRVFAIQNGPTGIMEFIPLVGGMEQGLFLPSASLLVGIRGSEKNPVEFALGPNLSVSGIGMVFAIGTNFHSGNINFPVNIAYVPSTGKREYNGATGETITRQTGHRITLTVGFNMRKK
jgi:hypothetical protein